MALVIVIAALLIGWQTRWVIRFPAVAVVVLLLAAVPFVQLTLGMLTKHAAAMIGSFYLLVLFAAIVIGCSSRDAKSNIFWRVIYSAIAVAALLNVAIQLVQWQAFYDSNYLTLIGFWISKAADPTRPSGSLLQPNQLATLFVWGSISILWLHHVGQIRAWIVFLAMASLAFGVYLTQSRAGMLELLLLSALAYWVPPAEAKRRAFLLMSGFTVAVVGLVLVMPVLAHMVADSGPVKPRNLGMVQDRLGDFKIFLYALEKSPWLGYGFGNLGPAFMAAASEHPSWYVGRLTLHSHNLFLDYLLWFGIPLGGVLIVASIAVYYKIATQARRLKDGYFFFAMVTALGVHAMVELPHQYLYFLAPAGLFLGYLSTPLSNVEYSVRLRKSLWLVAGFAGLFFVVLISLEYLRVQERYTEWRYENERVGKKLGLHLDKMILLQNFADELAFYNTRFHKQVDPDTQQWLIDTAIAANTAPGFFDLTVMLALNGRKSEAREWMLRLNAVNSPREWKVIDNLWRELQAKHAELADLDWPPLPSRKSY